MSYSSVYWKSYDRSNIFSQRDVFYNYLGKDPENADLAMLKNVALNSFDRHLNNVMQVSKNVEPYRRMAEYEKEKELALLREVFGQELTISLDKPQDAKMLIDALNSTLNIKEIYERNIEMLELSIGGRKSVISFFPTYFIQAWNDRWKEIYDATVKIFSSGKKITLEEALQKEINIRLDSITADAIERMFQAESEMKAMRGEDSQHKEAYKQLLNAFQNMPRYRNELVEQIRSIYKIDELSKAIPEDIKDKGHLTKQKIEKKLKTSPRTPIQFQTGRRGGLTLEAIEHLTFELVGDALKAKGISAKAIHTGNIGFMKNDNILALGINTGLIDEWMEDIAINNKGSSRKENIDRMRKLHALVENLDSGFLVYSSDKNYTLNKNFRDKFGFPAGSSISMNSFYEATRNVNKNARTFVGLIVNTIEGAIMGNDSAREKLSEAMATDFAMMMFDDYQTIGDFRGRKGAKVIHIMNLDNIMIPLSVFLTMLANAVERAETDVDDFVKVVLMTPEIEFKDYNAQSKWQFDNDESSRSAWTLQRDEALKKTRISVNFFKEFRDFITTLGK